MRLLIYPVAKFCMGLQSLGVFISDVTFLPLGFADIFWLWGGLKKSLFNDSNRHFTCNMRRGQCARALFRVDIVKAFAKVFAMLFAKLPAKVFAAVAIPHRCSIFADLYSAPNLFFSR